MCSERVNEGAYLCAVAPLLYLKGLSKKIPGRPSYSPAPPPRPQSQLAAHGWRNSIRSDYSCPTVSSPSLPQTPRRHAQPLRREGKTSALLMPPSIPPPQPFFTHPPFFHFDLSLLHLLSLSRTFTIIIFSPSPSLSLSLFWTHSCSLCVDMLLTLQHLHPLRTPPPGCHLPSTSTFILHPFILNCLFLYPFILHCSSQLRRTTCPSFPPPPPPPSSIKRCLPDVWRCTDVVIWASFLLLSFVLLFVSFRPLALVIDGCLLCCVAVLFHFLSVIHSDRVTLSVSCDCTAG